MNTSILQASNFKPIARKVATAIALASAMGTFGIAPAIGDDHDNRGSNGKDVGHRASRDQHVYRNRHRPDYHHPHPSAREVYAPPVVYYPPQASPGISLFVPLTIR